MTPVIVSLGWGVQSTALLAGAVHGLFPEIDPGNVIAVHADTTFERSATYEYAKRWTPWFEERGVKIVTVRPEKRDLPDTSRSVMIPAYTLQVQRRGNVWVATGKQGMLRRQCTNRWKIQPIYRWIRRNFAGEKVRVALGISLDEALRMKPSRVGYVENIFPLVNAGWTRTDCEAYLRGIGLDVPPKSACVFCPYQSAQEWASLTEDDLARAIAFDESIRHTRPGYRCYVHREMRPLSELDLSSPGIQLAFDAWLDECDGVCGL